MPPILRSVIAQCYQRGGRSIGSIRNFSGSSTGATMGGWRIGPTGSWYLSLALSGALGVGAATFTFPRVEAKLFKEIREAKQNLDRGEAILSEKKEVETMKSESEGSV